jgi:hypothetical protein
MAVILLDEIVAVRKKLEDLITHSNALAAELSPVLKRVRSVADPEDEDNVANVFLVRLQMLPHRLSRIQDSHTALLQTEIDLRGMPLQ